MFEFLARKHRSLNEGLEVLYKDTKVYRTVFGLTGDKQITEDAVQEAFIKAFNKLEQLKDKGKFGSWVITIAVNQAKDMLTNRARHRIVPIYEQIDIGLSDNRINSLEIRDEVNRVLKKRKNLNIAIGKFSF